MKLPLANTRDTWRGAAKIAKTNWKILSVTTVAQLAAAGAAVAIPFLVGKLLDQITHGTNSAQVTTYIWAFAALVLIQLVCTFVGEYAGQIFGERSFHTLRTNLMRDLLKLPLGTVENAGTGDMLGRITKDIDRIDFFFRRGLGAMLSLLATVIVTYVLAFWTSPLLAPVLFLPLLGMWPLGRWYFPKAIPAYQAGSAMWAEVNGQISENAEQAEHLESLGLVPLRNRRLRHSLTTIFNNERYTAWLRFWLLGVTQLNVLFPLLAVIGWGGYLKSHGLVSTGELTTIFLYVLTLRYPIDESTFWIDQIQYAQTSLSRILGVGTVPADRAPSVTSVTGKAWEMQDLRFRYGNGPEVLKGLDLRLEPGETLAIVGTSGAGKSTLARLLAGIDLPTGGTLTVGDVAIGDLAEDALHKQVALLTQEHHIFDATLAQNLQLAAPDATEEELMSALEAVGATWVRDLPDGLETNLGASQVHLSPSQAQQVALARLVLMDPHTLILDEATSMMDPNSARDIEHALGQVLQGRTVVMIAHRLFTAQDADRICVMEDGQIAELGTHDELVAAGGRYAHLWEAWTAQ
ncbi:hypothetical protein BSR28_02135 [Boudabousia liubingyangii]|uniref:ABC transporter ATP-binding protein n=1 Tax=Boudabousia liubingyangii TaxID=1921764 RepID=UPI000938A955|nr:ABC transporter ATP-binding protein [Boudabousia liubingyangii]OKL48510.1 hypothetical protein BSR28_02135 [Boudabousia liubingyangii]